MNRESINSKHCYDPESFSPQVMVDCSNVFNLHELVPFGIYGTFQSGPSGRAIWGVGLDRLDAENVGSNPA
jgi:hypothetical protein